jgi:hypothetical protein
MGIIIKIVLLLGLIKLLEATDKPLVCATVYVIVAGFISLALSVGSINWGGLMIGLAISFVSAFVYFWLLQKTEGSIFWWIIMLGGFFIGLI